MPDTTAQGAAMTEEDEALLPCPFCGGVAELGDADECGSNAYVVCCTGCQASSAVKFASKHDPRHELIEMWNLRSQAREAERVRAEALEEAAKEAERFIDPHFVGVTEPLAKAVLAGGDERAMSIAARIRALAPQPAPTGSETT